MTSALSIASPRTRPGGFTMLEALLALFIFSTTVISLVEAINITGSTVIVARRERQVQAKLEMLLLEATRSPEMLSRIQNNDLSPITVKEGDVTYVTRPALLNLSNSEGKPLQELFVLNVTARWTEGRVDQESSAETWVFPPLFQPRIR